VRKKTSHQGAFEESFLHFDHPLLVGGRCLEPSDRGKSAALIFDAAEVTPLWLRLWRIQYAKLPRKAKRILDAMLVDERSLAVAKRTGISRNAVKRWKTKFKVHFAQCLSARNRVFSDSETDHF